MQYAKASGHIFIAVLLMLCSSSNLFAATDPDGDPAVAIDAEAYGSAELVVDEVAAFLQESEDGELYARIEVTVRNDGELPVHKHLWSLEGQGFSASSVTSGTIEPNQERTFTKLAFGSDVARLVESGYLSVGISRPATQSTQRCFDRGSRESCETSAAALQDACHASCLRSGLGFGGQMSCAAYEVRDETGNTCTVWETWCQCASSPTLSETLATDFFNPSNPVIQDLIVNPPRVEVRQLFP